MDIVLSLFPGAGLLDHGFTQAGFCVVRGPDTLLGGDIRRFKVPPGSFRGVIGGPPCQDFSRARRRPPTGQGEALVREYGRVVIESQCEWWLMECVPGVPSLDVPGWKRQRFNITASSFGLPHRRLRSFQFGHRGQPIVVPSGNESHPVDPTPLASQAVGSFRARCRMMGLPTDYNLHGLSRSAKFRAVGNGVAVPVAYAIACAISARAVTPKESQCACECGRRVTGNALTASQACRKRLSRMRAGWSPKVISVTLATSQPETAS